MKKYDLIIIVAGPAGLTAGIYASRYKLKTLILGEILGGTASEAYEICNYPGFEKIKGYELIKKFLEQAKMLGAEIKIEEALEIKKNSLFTIKTNKSEYSGKKIIIATGTKRTRLNLPNEKELAGKGISYCAVCYAAFYKDKIVGVAGGGNAALTAAILLSKFAKKVYLIYRRNEFKKAEPVWVDEIKKNKKIEIMFNKEIKELIGNERLDKIKLSDNALLEVDGLFVEIGSVSNISLAQKLGLEIKNDFILVDKTQETNIKGIFAAGDVTNNALKQVITACSEGATAATYAYRSIEKEKSEKE